MAIFIAILLVLPFTVRSIHHLASVFSTCHPHHLVHKKDCTPVDHYHELTLECNFQDYLTFPVKQPAELSIQFPAPGGYGYLITSQDFRQGANKLLGYHLRAPPGVLL